MFGSDGARVEARQAHDRALDLIREDEWLQEMPYEAHQVRSSRDMITVWAVSKESATKTIGQDPVRSDLITDDHSWEWEVAKKPSPKRFHRLGLVPDLKGWRRWYC